MLGLTALLRRAIPSSSHQILPISISHLQRICSRAPSRGGTEDSDFLHYSTAGNPQMFSAFALRRTCFLIPLFKVLRCVCFACRVCFAFRKLVFQQKSAGKLRP